MDTIEQESKANHIALTAAQRCTQLHEMQKS